ncbi:hypothetical protein CS379_06160, partial [Methylobacterium frigidaeris]
MQDITMIRQIAAALLLIASLGAVRADGLVPVGDAPSGLCYAQGGSGARVPCVRQGETWTRVLRPTDPADGMTVGGTAISAILGGKAPLASPAFTGALSILSPPNSTIAGSTQTVVNGGTQANHGDHSVASGAAHFRGPDDAEQMRIGWFPAATAYTHAIGGNLGTGATYSCQDDANADAACNVIAQGRGRINVGNGSGIGLQVLDPGA